MDLTPIIQWLEGGCDPKAAIRELKLAQRKIDRMDSALKVIQVWAQFQMDAPSRETLVPKHVIDVCERAMR